MRKFLLPGILAVFAFFLPSWSQAQPLDAPYRIFISTASNLGAVTFSTMTFPSAIAAINTEVTTDQWCVEHVSVSANSAATFTMAWATSTITGSTTDYAVAVATGVPYDVVWPYRDPYCAPVGQAVLNIRSSVATSTITVSGYLWRGWNP